MDTEIRLLEQIVAEHQAYIDDCEKRIQFLKSNIRNVSVTYVNDREISRGPLNNW